MKFIVLINTYRLSQKKVCPLLRPQTAHKRKKIVNMNADISETIKDRKMESKI